MDSKYQWVQNKYEPGLFTFCLQEQSLCPPKVKQDGKLTRNNFNKRKFESYIKIIPKPLSSQRYYNPKVAQSPRSPRKQFNISKATNSFKRINNNLINSQRLQSSNLLRIESLQQKKVQILKKTNINKDFQYNKNNALAKMFIYRRQPTSYIKKMSKKCLKNPQQMSTSQYSTNENKWRVNTQQATIDRSKQSIDSDGDVITKANEKLSFLDFLLERNRQERIMKSNSKKKKIQMALLKLNGVNPPKMLQVPSRLTDKH